MTEGWDYVNLYTYRLSMLLQETFFYETTEAWEWDGFALIRRKSDIYVNEPHISGGVPILTKTNEGIRYHEHDFLGTTLWSTDTKGNLVKDYQDTTIFGEGSIQKDRSARFTGKPYDEDLQAYVFSYRNYDATTARWSTSDSAGYPDGINNRFYAAIPTYVIDLFGIWIIRTINFSVFGSVGEKIITGNNKFNGVAYGFCTINFKRKVTDTGDSVFFYSSSINTTVGSITYANQRVELDSSLDEINININMSFIFNKLSSKGYLYFFSITTVSEPTLTQTFWVVEND